MVMQPRRRRGERAGGEREREEKKSEGLYLGNFRCVDYIC